MWSIATSHSRREYQPAGRALWQRLQLSAHICVRPRRATAVVSSAPLGGAEDPQPMSVDNTPTSRMTGFTAPSSFQNPTLALR